MNFVSFPGLKCLPDNVPAVAGGIDDGVPAPGAGASLQHGFQRRKIIIVFPETQIINEQDELQRLSRQLIQQPRQQMQAAFVQLDQPDPLVLQLAGHSLHRGGLACSRVTVQQDIGGFRAPHQRPGVFQHLFLLCLVAHQILQPDRIRIGHRQQPVAGRGPVIRFQPEHMPAGEVPEAIPAHGRHPFQPLRVQPAVILHGVARLVAIDVEERRGQQCHFRQRMQLGLGCRKHHRRNHFLLTGKPYAAGFQGQNLLREVPGPVGLPGFVECMHEFRIAFRFRLSEQFIECMNHRIFFQPPEQGETPGPAIVILRRHQRLITAPLSALETIAA